MLEVPVGGVQPEVAVPVGGGGPGRGWQWQQRSPGPGGSGRRAVSRSAWVGARSRVGGCILRIETIVSANLKGGMPNQNQTYQAFKLPKDGGIGHRAGSHSPYPSAASRGRRENSPLTNGSLKGGLLPACGGVKQATATTATARRSVFASRAVRVQVGGPSTARASSEDALVQARPRGVTQRRGLRPEGG